MNEDLMYQCIDIIVDYVGLLLTEDQFTELMKENPYLEEQLIEFQSPSDTMEREDLMNAVAVKVTGRAWPTYGDGEKVRDEFFREYSEKAKKMGYKIIG